MKVKSDIEVAQCVRPLVTPWTAAHKAPPSMGFSRQEYWSGVPLPSPRGNMMFDQRLFWSKAHILDELLDDLFVLSLPEVV